MEMISPSHIKKLQKNKKLIPFVGAGFSANIKKYPLWDDFIDILQDDLNIGLPTGVERVNFERMFGENDPAECAQYYYWKKGHNQPGSIAEKLAYGKSKFKELVLKKFDSPTYDKDEFNQHEALVNRFSRIYTTNWDDLLEHTCLHSVNNYGYTRFIAPINTVQYGGQFKELKEDIDRGKQKREIIKYHGCQSDNTSTSIIASTADYYERISLVNIHPLDRKIANDMKLNDFLFLGYSMRDINVKYILNQINFNKWGNHLNETGKNINFYVITFDDPADFSQNRAKYLESCNFIKHITLCDPSHEILHLKKKYKQIMKLKKRLQSKNIEKNDARWISMRMKRDKNLDQQRLLMKNEINLFLNNIS